MTTSISSKAFCSITDRQTYKIFTEQMLIYEGNLHKKIWERYLNQGPRKSRFPLNLTYIHTYRRTNISVYRVASLLKNNSPRYQRTNNTVTKEISVTMQKFLQRDKIRNAVMSKSLLFRSLSRSSPFKNIVRVKDGELMSTAAQSIILQEMFWYINSLTYYLLFL